jgi:5-methylcytosine-specific restriction protein A
VPTRLPTLGTGRPKQKQLPADRPSPSRRGYGRNWQRVRLAVLSEEPLCRDCKAAGRIVEATEVDHVDGDVSNLDRANLVPKCKPCHSRKTVAQDGGLGHSKRGR